MPKDVIQQQTRCMLYTFIALRLSNTFIQTISLLFKIAFLYPLFTSMLI